jgi:hypothetical protein
MDRGNADAGCSKAVKLVFVYNAEAGLVHGIMDSIHKLVSPATYKCDLCAITYGLTRMKEDWRAWLERSGWPVQFFHRSDFRQAWPGVNVQLPAILVQENGALSVLVSATELAHIDNVGQLVTVLENKCGGAGK